MTGGTLNLLVVLSTLIPRTIKGGFLTDGAQLLGLVFGDSKMERDIQGLEITVTMTGGVRPREFPLHIVNWLVAECERDPNNVGVHRYLYYHLLDSGRTDEAGRTLDRALGQGDETIAKTCPALLAEAAFFEARFRTMSDLPQQRLALASTGQVEEATLWRAEAAILFAENKKIEAVRRIDAALHFLESSKDLGGRVAEDDWLRQMRPKDAGPPSFDPPRPGSTVP